MADPNFNNGNYYNGTPPEKGLSIARMSAHITYLSQDSMEIKFGRNIKNTIHLSQNGSRSISPVCSDSR